MALRGENVNLFRRKWFILLLVFLLVLWGVWTLFFNYEKCDNLSCFNNQLEDCGKAKFVGGTKMIFEYTILGDFNGECRVNVKLLQGDLNNRDSRKLEMKEMVCNLPKGVVMIPESNIGKCHGLLKEGLQDLVIEKLHTYLVQNLGRINLEVLDIPKNVINQSNY